MPDFLNLQFLNLVFGGFVIGIFAVVVGGAMFISIPYVQWLFPSATIGAVVGNIKVSSFFRSVGSTISTWKKIEFIENLKLMPAAIVGTVIGAASVSHINQKWMLPAILSAIAFTIYAPKLAHKVTKKTFAIAAFITGLYTGILGAGVGVMLVALMRLKYPKDAQIGHVKIQARFVEFVLTISAVITFFFNGSLLLQLWLPLSIGGLVGGYAGGLVLDKMGEMPGKWQKLILYSFFCVDIYVAARKFFE